MSEVSFGLCLFAFLLCSLDVTDKRYWCKQKNEALLHPNIRWNGMVLLQFNITWTFKKHNQDLLLILKVYSSWDPFCKILRYSIIHVMSYMVCLGRNSIAYY